MINEMEGLRMRVEYLVWALLYHYSFMPQLPMCSAAPGLQPDAEPQPKEVNESHNPHTEKMIETFREEPIAGDAMHRFGQYGIRARSEGLGGIMEKLDQLNLSLCDKLYGTTGGDNVPTCNETACGLHPDDTINTLHCIIGMQC